MLLRSSSTPILNSWLPHSKDSSSPEPEIIHQIPRTRSISLSVSSSTSSCLLSPIGDSTQKMTRALSETDLRDVSMTKKKPFNKTLDGFFEEEEEERGLGFRCAKTMSLDGGGVGLFSSCGLDEGCEVGSKDNGLVSLLVEGGVGGGGGRICGGGGGWNGGDGDDGNSEFWDSNHGNHSTDLYYQKMIEANPGNPLLLSNYAKFLKDVSFFFF